MSITEIIPRKKYRVRVYGKPQHDGTRSRLTETVMGTHADAKKTERRMLGERDEGRLGGPAPTLTVYLNEYLAEREGKVAPQTMRVWRYLADKHIIPRIGKVRLNKVKPPVLRRFYDDLMADKDEGGAGLSKTTASKAHRLLSLVFKRAVGDEVLHSNPCQSVDAPGTDTAEKRTLDADQVDALLSQIEGTRLHLPALVAVNTGLRRGEVLGLRFSDVDFAAGVIHVSGAICAVTHERKTTKTKSGARDVMLPLPLAAALKRHKATMAERRMLAPDRWTDGDYVFPSLDMARGKKAGGPWSPGAFTALWCKADTGWTFHELRHTAITNWRKAGIRLELAQYMAGHAKSSQTLLAVYSHVSPEKELDEAREAMARAARNPH